MSRVYEYYCGEWDEKGDPIPEKKEKDPHENLKPWEDICDSCKVVFHVKQLNAGFCEDCTEDYFRAFGSKANTKLVICVNNTDHKFG